MGVGKNTLHRAVSLQQYESCYQFLLKLITTLHENNL